MQSSKRLWQQTARLTQEAASQSTQPVASTSTLSPRQPLNGLLLGHTPPVQVQAEHKYHVASLNVHTYAPNLRRLELATEFARRAAAALGIPCSNVTHLPTRTQLQTVPTGPFVHKKSQENFWRKTHGRQLKIYDADERVVQVWLQFVAQHALPDVRYKSQQFVWRDVGFGKDIQPAGAKEELNEPSEGQGAAPTDEQVKAQAEKIIKQLEDVLKAPEVSESSGEAKAADHARDGSGQATTPAASQ